MLLLKKSIIDSVRDTPVGTTNSHKWWSSLKIAFFGLDVAVPPLLRSDGALTDCPKEKAAILLMCFIINRIIIILLCHSHVFLRIN